MTDPENMREYDARLSAEFYRRLARYMGEYNPKSVFANRYPSWYRDHAGGRSDWFRANLIWRLELARPLAMRRVLDFGCGTGSSSVVIAEKNARVVGVDTEQVSIEVACQRAKDLGLLDRCSFVRIPPLGCRESWLPFGEGSFDLCTMVGVLEHMKPRERTACAAEIRRVLRPGGELFIFDTPNRAHPFDHHTTRLWFIGWVPEGIAREYSILRRRFEPGQDFRRLGGNGISRNQIDQLFPVQEWQVSYEKSAEEVAGEFAWLGDRVTILPSALRKRAERCFAGAAWGFLKEVRLFGCRPTWWTSSHTLCFRKLPRS